jgi:hypothetical protein
VSEAVIFGQSHINAIAAALARRPEPKAGTRVFRLGTNVDAGEITTREAVEIVRKLPPGASIFVSCLGTYHNVLGLLQSGEAFDFLISASDCVDKSHGTAIPHRAIASAFETTFSSSNMVRRLKQAAASPLYLLGTPPPKQSNDFILQCFMRQKRPSYRGQSVAEVGIESPESRQKLWQLEAKLLKIWADSQGIGFIPVPTEAFDGDGFLARRYYSDDVTHANADYGELVIRQIDAILQQAEKAQVNA